MCTWSDYAPHVKSAVRRRIAELVVKSHDKELTHEHIEEALTDIVPELKNETVENDAFHELITIVYAEYRREGAVE